jgi:hypothetical protein
MDKDELLMCALGFVVVGAVILSGGRDSVGSFLQSSSEIKQLRDNTAKEAVISASLQESVSDRAQIALQRFQNGCVVHLQRAEYQRPEDVAVGAVTMEFRPISEGESPINWQTGQPYSEGTVLCDWLGGVGVIQGGTVTDYSFSGTDVSDLVRKNVEKFQ